MHHRQQDTFAQAAISHPQAVSRPHLPDGVEDGEAGEHELGAATGETTFFRALLRAQVMQALARSDRIFAREPLAIDERADIAVELHVDADKAGHRAGITDELTAARTRHPQILTVKSGVKDGRFVALELRVLENTGAYGTHALTVMSVTGNRALPLYRCPNLRYEARAVYTNLAVAGAFRG